jgi:hypothetical protein
MLFALEGRGFEVLTFDLPRTTLIELAVYIVYIVQPSCEVFLNRQIALKYCIKQYVH